MPKTDKQIVEECNALAKKLAATQGWVWSNGDMPLHESTTSRAKEYWALAALAYEHITKTDPYDALNNITQ